MGDSILLAVTSRTRDRLAAVLGGHRVTWARTLDEVQAALQQRSFDLIVIGSHFQESTTFDVLRVVGDAKSAARTVCVRTPFEGSLLGRSSVQAFRSACEVLGANVVLDLGDFPDDEAGRAALRAAIEHELELVP